jgi:hypothetical protein
MPKSGGQLAIYRLANLKNNRRKYWLIDDKILK